MLEDVLEIALGDTGPALEGICRGGDGAAVDLTGRTVRVGIRRYRTTVTVHSADAEIVGDPEDGRVKFAWPAGLTTTLGVGEYEYEFELRGGGEVATFPGGASKPRFRIVRDIVPEPTP